MLWLHSIHTSLVAVRRPHLKMLLVSSIPFTNYIRIYIQFRAEIEREESIIKLGFLWWPEFVVYYYLSSKNMKENDKLFTKCHSTFLFFMKMRKYCCGGGKFFFSVMGDLSPNLSLWLLTCGDDFNLRHSKFRKLFRENFFDTPHFEKSSKNTSALSCW